MSRAGASEVSAVLENLTVPILLTVCILGGRGRHNVRIERLLSYLFNQQLYDNVNDDADKRIARLEAEITEMKTKDKKREQEATVIKILDTEGAKYNLTKNAKVKRSIEKEVLATAASPGNRHDIPTLYKQIVEERLETMKELTKATSDNDKVNQFIDRIPRGGGGLPKIDPEEKYTPEDIKSGKAQSILEGVLRKRLEEE